MRFHPGKTYSRLYDIHHQYGGSRQSGISPSASHPLIFVFTGNSGSNYGYRDNWDDQNQFIYCGEGQVGDMEFTKGNLAIRDHSKNGREIHLFHALGKGKPVRYLGEFVCTGWQIKKTPDRNRNERDGIFFRLLPIELIPSEDPNFIDQNSANPTTSIDELRRVALQGASPPTENTSKTGVQTTYNRSTNVKKYVLARSGGICEGCDSPAPFIKVDGTPYLEPHHIRRLSDGGPDDPRWVIALCPNCHRRIHSGSDGQAYNTLVTAKLRNYEPLDR